jgi:nitrite reductase/ring-hydroxylating ferredoxin subunit
VSEEIATEVVDVSDLEAGGLRAIELHGRKLLLCRVADEIYAIENRCPHAEVPLTHGQLRGHELVCPFHGGRLDVRDGSPVEAPIRRAAGTFAVRQVAQAIEIEIPLAGREAETS